MQKQPTQTVTSADRAIRRAQCMALHSRPDLWRCCVGGHHHENGGAGIGRQPEVTTAGWSIVVKIVSPAQRSVFRVVKPLPFNPVQKVADPRRQVRPRVASHDQANRQLVEIGDRHVPFKLLPLKIHGDEVRHEAVHTLATLQRGYDLRGAKPAMFRGDESRLFCGT